MNDDDRCKKYSSNGDGDGLWPHAKPAKQAAGLNPSRIGLVQWFHLGQHELVEQTIADMHRLGLRHLRTGISWADMHTPQGRQWYQWLLPLLGRQLELLPCVLYVPPSIAVAPKISAPPREARAYADFLDELARSYGRYFEWVELWNEANNVTNWDWTLDRDWNVFCSMIGSAAYWMKHLGKKTLLGGMSPVDPNWLRMLYRRGVMQYIDAVGVHGFPGDFESNWAGWDDVLARVRKEIESQHGSADIWISEAGFSTWKHEQRKQVEQMVQAAVANGAERMYWYGLYDLPPQYPTVDGFHSDEREYYFGMKTAGGDEKLLFRAIETHSLEGLAAFAQQIATRPYRAEKANLITGGAGFIGTNLADKLMTRGEPVIIYDNLSRAGVEANLRWLERKHGSLLHVEIADVRDKHHLAGVTQHAKRVFHFAAQVAVTDSLVQPELDFDVNLRGTMNLLEAIRRCEHPPALLFTSTNKVYGALEDIPLECDFSRYRPADEATGKTGISELRPLSFCSPYGCSKGGSDQYVLDYARSFGIPAVVFRMSCIYGPHQLGTEDQGWVAHFLIRALCGGSLVIYGDGKQVRDILYVGDLVRAMLLAQDNMPSLAGQAFNMGGGPGNTISLLELLDLIEVIHGRLPDISHDGWRIGDQKYYVSDTSKFRNATGWQPTVDVRAGVLMLYEWLSQAMQRRHASEIERLRERQAQYSISK